MTAKRANQREEELSPEIITLLQSDNDGIHFMFKPNTLLGGMERDGNPFIFGSDLTLPCSISQLAEWLLSQRIDLESLAFEGRNAMLNWLDGIMHSKPLVGSIKKAEVARKEAEQRENQFLVEEMLSTEEVAAQQVEWDRYVSGMEYWENVTQLTAHEFCCLRHIHDPRNFEQEKNTIPGGTGKTLESRVADDERIIERDPAIDGKRAMSLADWVTWAEHKNWAIPGFISRATENPNSDGGSSAKQKVSEGVKNQPLKMKKAALVAMLECEGYENIETAFRHSGGIGGLSEAAKHQSHGYWYVDKARAWFEQEKTKTNHVKSPNNPGQQGMWNGLPGMTTHKM